MTSGWSRSHALLIDADFYLNFTCNLANGEKAAVRVGWPKRNLLENLIGDK